MTPETSPPLAVAEGGMAPNPFFDAELDGLKKRGYGRDSWRLLLTNLAARAAENTAARPELARELGRLRAVGLAGCVVVAVALARAGVGPVGWIAPLLLWLLLCAWVGVELGLVRHPLTSEPAPAIGAATAMTLFRGWAGAPMLALALTMPGPSALWAGLGIAGGLTDLADGAVARRLGQESRLGRLLDPFMDAVFFSSAAIALARWRLLPWPLAPLITLRYFVPILGGVGLMLARGQTLPVRHTPWGQRSTMVVGLALLAHWLQAVGVLPVAVPLGLDFAGVLTMGLALAGIVRRR
ncbi:MAG: CDP-alcohol phosphatidyltransferase family protein [Candidatus Dormibacteria bacterium]